MALMAQLTQRGEVCALVDASDSFDPKSAFEAGVGLNRLLWVRCSKKATIEGQRLTTSGQWSAASGQPKSQITNRKSQMDCLEQALKATDLLLQGGGFGLVAVDLGDVPAQVARRVPLTSWFRFRRAVENTRTVLAVVEQEPYAKTCASVVVRLSARLQASGVRLQEKQEPPHARILARLEITAEGLRSAAHGKKPVRSARAHWESRMEWAG
jgi:recombination protein RecA